MGEGQRRQRTVTDEARGTASAASPRRDVEIAKDITKAIPAKAGRPAKRWCG
jgi:hypothetical protein